MTENDSDQPYPSDVTTVEVPHALVAFLQGKEIEDGSYRLWDDGEFYNLAYEDEYTDSSANWSCNFRDICHLGPHEFRLTSPRDHIDPGTGVTVKNLDRAAPTIDSILLVLSRDWSDADPGDMEFDMFRFAGDKYRVEETVEE